MLRRVVAWVHMRWCGACMHREYCDDLVDIEGLQSLVARGVYNLVDAVEHLRKEGRDLPGDLNQVFRACDELQCALKRNGRHRA